MIRILFVFFGTLAPLMAVPLSNNQNEVKNPLDTVLMGYDKRVRPYFGNGRPVTVGVSAYVLSIVLDRFQKPRFRYDSESCNLRIGSIPGPT